MRVSSLQIFNIAKNGLSEANQAIVKTQKQLSSGQRVLSPSDDPVASTKIVTLSQEIAITEQYRKNIDIAKNDLTIEEASLKGVLNIVQRIQELAVQAGNTAIFSQNDYRAMASEVETRIDELKNILNSKNSSGDFIFGGYKSTREPFTGTTRSGFEYNGDDGQKYIKVANNTFVASSDSGKDIFVDVESERPTINTYASPSNTSNSPPGDISVGRIIDHEVYDEFYPESMVITFNQDNVVAPTGRNFTITEKSTGRILVANQRFVPGEEIIVNGASLNLTGNPRAAGPGTPGDTFFIDSSNRQDILTTLSRFGEAMLQVDGSTESREQLTETVADTLFNLGHAQTNVLDITSEIGARINTLESTEQLHLDSDLVLQELLSDLKDLDYAEAASRLSQQTLIIQAAQASFARVSQLSLFDRL